MIYPETYFCAKCDNCGDVFFDDHNGYSAFSDASQMQDVLNDFEWHTEDDKHYCPSCFEFDDEDNLVIKIERKDKHVH